MKINKKAPWYLASEEPKNLTERCGACFHCYCDPAGWASCQHKKIVKPNAAVMITQEVMGQRKPRWCPGFKRKK